METRFTPGFVTGSMARSLQETGRATEAATLKQRQQVPVRDLRPYMKLTARDAVTGYYSWTEQAINNDGTPYDKDSGLSGTPTWNPARELNGRVIVNFPHYTRATKAIQSDTLGSIFDFEESILPKFPSVSNLVTSTVAAGVAATADLILPTAGLYSYSGCSSLFGGDLFASMASAMSIVGGAAQGQCTSGSCFAWANVWYTTPVDFVHQTGGNTLNRAGGTFFSGWAQTLVDNAVLRLTVTDTTAFPSGDKTFQGSIEAILFA